MTLRLKAETTVGIFIIVALCAFFYMTLRMGFFHVDKARYVYYEALFKDIAGLNKKADVKIAGVKVGWVDSITLNEDGHNVKAKIMILRKYKLYQDTQAIVRQEGVLGGKFLELIPGNPKLCLLQSGDSIEYSPREVVALDDLMQSVKRVTQNVEQITQALKNVISNSDTTNNMQQTIANFNETIAKISCISTSLDSLVMKHENNFTAIVDNINDVTKALKQQLPDLYKTVATCTPQATQHINQVAQTVQATAVNLNAGIAQAQEALQAITAIAQKINSGTGSLGQILNEPETYQDIKQIVTSLKNITSIGRSLSFSADLHTESLRAYKNKNCAADDFKTYFNTGLRYLDYFAIAGVTYSRKGIIKRDSIYKDCYSYSNYKDSFNRVKAHHDSLTLNLQFGKIYNNTSFRFGIFEGSAGLAGNYIFPLFNNKYTLVTSLEAFDFNGKNRLYRDKVPHLKWLNRLYFTPNIYLAFGADDFISKYNKTAFIGAGLTFF
jgi:phospholipid/cholesterol/gamma-HCH transport system substrate-binding protein